MVRSTGQLRRSFPKPQRRVIRLSEHISELLNMEKVDVGSGLPPMAEGDIISKDCLGLVLVLRSGTPLGDFWDVYGVLGIKTGRPHAKQVPYQLDFLSGLFLNLF